MTIDANLLTGLHYGFGIGVIVGMLVGGWAAYMMVKEHKP